MGQFEQMKTSIRLSVKNPNTQDDAGFGYGIAALCAGVREKGSLNAAAKGMGMAYSKAWRVIRDSEASLGIQLLERDGAHGSVLTPEGAKLLDAYLEIAEHVSAEAERLFHEKLDQF
ncbi:MAG: LysR family transcriptional regulator [Eggerthellaceae bacterium]|nr:LysR family transcriptional regulator [Eggerthellaceae bacterium]